MNKIINSDLIYADKEVEQIFKNKFPKCKITDASDYVHMDRFNVEFDEMNIEKYFMFLIDEKIGGVSFCLSLAIQNTNKTKKDKEILDRLLQYVKSKKN